MLIYASCLLLGVAIGTWASEIAWRASAPFLGTGQQTPTGRVLLGAGAILGGAGLITFVARQDVYATIPATTWTDVLAVCLGAELWLACSVFARLTSGGVAVRLRRSAAALNALVAIGSGVLIGMMLLEVTTFTLPTTLTLIFGASGFAVVVHRLIRLRAAR